MPTCCAFMILNLRKLSSMCIVFKIFSSIQLFNIQARGKDFNNVLASQAALPCCDSFTHLYLSSDRGSMRNILPVGFISEKERFLMPYPCSYKNKPMFLLSLHFVTVSTEWTLIRFCVTLRMRAPWSLMKASIHCSQSVLILSVFTVFILVSWLIWKKNH